MKEKYTKSEFDRLIKEVKNRHGWDFSSMNVLRETVSWEYIDEVRKYLKSTDVVLDIGTGGGERFIMLANSFSSGLGVDIDGDMIKIAKSNSTKVINIEFRKSTEKLETVDEQFNLIINRHAPFDLNAVKEHLKTGGLFITQQVGEKNMLNIKKVLGQEIGSAPISKSAIEQAGLKCLEFKEYNVEYVVKDVESLVFWLNALDSMHADFSGDSALKDVDTFNKVLAGNVDKRGFVTNEQRYLVVAKHVHYCQLENLDSL